MLIFDKLICFAFLLIVNQSTIVSIPHNPPVNNFNIPTPVSPNINLSTPKEPKKIEIPSSNKIGLKLNISPIVNILKPIKFKKQSKTKIINNEFFDIYFLILSTYFTLNYYQCSIFYFFSQFLLDYHVICFLKCPIFNT